MTTTGQRLNRAALQRAVKEEQRRIRRDAVESLHRQIDDIRKRRTELTSRVKMQCAAARARVRDRVAERRQELEREIQEMRQAERNRCALRKARVKHQSESARERVRREARERVRDELAGRRIERHHMRESKKLRKSERSQEDDDAVRANLEPEFVPIFDVVRAKIRARAGMSRTEAFLHWLEEHPDELWRLREDLAERRLRALLKEAQEAERALRRAGGKRETARRRAELEPAPF